MADQNNNTKHGEKIKKLQKDVKHLTDILQTEFGNLRELFISEIRPLYEEIDGLAEDIDYIKTKTSSSSRHLKTLAKGLKLPVDQFMSDTDNHFFKRSSRDRHSRGRRNKNVYESARTSNIPVDRSPNFPVQPVNIRYQRDASPSSSDSGEDTVEATESSQQAPQNQQSQFSNQRKISEPVQSQPSDRRPVPQNIKTKSSDRQPRGPVVDRKTETPATSVITETPTTSVTTTTHSNIEMPRSSVPVADPPRKTEVPVDTIPKETTDIPAAEKPVMEETHNITSRAPSSNIKDYQQQRQRDHQTSLNLNDVEAYITSAKIELTAETRNAMQEAFQRDESRQVKPEGLYTVLLVDTSKSMDGEAATQTRQFLTDFIDEVENSAAYNNLEENIAVITFGASTSIKQRFTNDYSNIRDVIENLEFEGRTPLLTGLAMSVKYLRECGKTVKVSSTVNVIPRIVLVTDGCVTDDGAFTGIDHEPNSIQCQTKVLNFLKATKQYGYPIIRVGVGDFNKPFLNEFPCDGEMIDANDVLYLARHYLYQTIVGKVVTENDEQCGNGDVDAIVRDATRESESDTRSLRERDGSEIAKLLKNHNVVYNGQLEAAAALEEDAIDEEDDQSDDEALDEFGVQDKFARLLSVGTRVVRGPNWQWGDQDGNGPGTVVAHFDEGELIVKWDNGTMNKYYYNHNGISHVTKHYLHRILKPGENIQVGCSVRRGRDWNHGDVDGGNGTEGMVIRKHHDKQVSVRWPSQVVERYSYGHNGKYEVEIVGEVTDNTGHKVTGTDGEDSIVYAWQWKDPNQQWRTLPVEEAAKLEDLHENKTEGTILVSHYNMQLRCDPFKMQYRGSGGGDFKGEIQRIMLPQSELDNFHALEMAML